MTRENTPRPRIPYAERALFAIGKQRTFTGPQLAEIAFPIGGIGAGCISLNGYGGLRDWEIFNRPGKGNRPSFTYFTLWARRGNEKPVTKIVEAQPNPPFVSSHGFLSQNGAGFPHLAEASFYGAFPFARIAFRDPDVPLSILLEAFNPFIPLAAEESALPLVVLKYHLENRTDKPVRLCLCGSMLNVAGYDSQAPLSAGGPWAGSNVNEIVRDKHVRGLRFTTQKYDAGHPQFGSAALTTTHPNITFQTRWPRDHWFHSTRQFWDQLSGSGKLADNDPVDPSPDGITDVGALGAKLKLEPGEQQTVTFLVTWHFPLFEHYWGGEKSKGLLLSPRYARCFEDAWDVATYAAANLDRLEARTRRFHNVLFGSTLPAHVLDALSSQMSTLKTNTAQWFADGTFHAFEGCSDRSGCCTGSCTHVWNYEQSMAFLFPSLERDMRVTDFEYNTDEEGYMSFRHPMPRGTEFGRGRPAADGQMGCLIKLYREWQLSGDQAFLQQLWPYAKRALEFSWAEWDKDQDGIMEAIQHNTYDIEFHGPNPMVGALYLGALRAGEEMAEAVGDQAAAKAYRAVYEEGRHTLDTALWNGEYYFQKYDAQAVTRNQFGTGCLSDQLLGQWFARVVGLGDLLQKDHVRKALTSVFRYNWRSDLSAHVNCQRVYALNEEAGLLTCTWPKGGRPAVPFLYSDEVWTGIEYQVAAHLIYEGFIKEGLTIVKGARNRHDGERRNPWDEPECGHHYARAMSSWSLLLALSGFQYSAPHKRIAFAPKVSADRFKTFWSTASGWGEFSQRVKGSAMTSQLAVVEGTLDLAALGLQRPKGARRRPALSKATCARRPLQASLATDKDRLDVTFEEPLSLSGGQTLRVVLAV